jgi:hypothetical protein
MSDLELYRLIKKNASEFHDDGIFFIAPWDLEEFTRGLGIKDAENGVEAHIVTDGYLAIDAHNLEYNCEDIDGVINALIEDFNFDEFK